MQAMRRFPAVSAAGLVLLLPFPAASLQSPPAPARAVAAPKAPPPPGWTYLPELGAKDIFQLAPQPASGPRPQMHVFTHNDVGILTRPASLPLDANTTLSWRWKMTRLPSALAEDVTPRHDYFSIAVKFDNGQDLTYMWSAALPVGHGFRCPLPNWKARETHVVVRSGERDFGQWLAEEHNVLADYARHVGGPPPARITEVWLIANTSIQRTEGTMDYADITVGPRGRAARRVRVL
jgi:hypothetical protein